MTAEIQRPLRGSRISSFYPVKSLPSLSSLDSAFQLQEYISLLIRLDVHDVNAIVSLPSKSPDQDQEAKKDSEESEQRDKEKEKGEGEKEVAVDCWIYEQLRRLAQDLTHPLITTLQQECTRASCPEMKAGEWLYLCVAHGNDGAMEQCCAIDYILHTLDSATALLSSPRAFPSRIQIPPTSHRHFSSLARRLGRIFAHAYFHHREAFEQAEAESSLYARFLALTSKFDLVPSEFLVIPPNAVGHHLHDEDDEDEGRGEPRLPPNIAHPQHPVLLHPTPSAQISLHPQQQQQSRKSKSPPSLGIGAPPSPGLDSPRRVGRNRTDTMVHSDARDIVEDLANRFGGQEEEEPTGVKTARPGEEFDRGPESPVDEDPPATPVSEQPETSEVPLILATEPVESREETPVPEPEPVPGLVEPEASAAAEQKAETTEPEEGEIPPPPVEVVPEMSTEKTSEPETKEQDALPSEDAVPSGVPEEATSEPTTAVEAPASDPSSELKEEETSTVDTHEHEETKTFAEVVKESVEGSTTEETTPAEEAAAPVVEEGEAKEVAAEEPVGSVPTVEASPASTEAEAGNKDEDSTEGGETQTPPTPESGSQEKKEEVAVAVEVEVEKTEKDAPGVDNT